METIQNTSQPFDVARVNTYSAPGVNRCLDEAPSRALDKHLSSAELISSIKLTLGVDVADGNSLCRYCAAVVDAKGIHPNSCTAGGDCTLRHNEVRDKLYRWALRGRLDAELEKAGILDEPAVMIPSMRRPADVLIDDVSNRLDKMALVVKVINALGPEHYSETLVGGLQAADRYRAQVMEFQDTAARCAQRGVRFEPIVFTCQGGLQSNAEAILTCLAVSIAKAEDTEPGVIKAELLADLSRTLVRAASRAFLRRASRYHTDDACDRILEAAATLED